MKKLSHKNTIKALSAVALPVWVVKSLEILRIYRSFDERERKKIVDFRGKLGNIAKIAKIQ